MKCCRAIVPFVLKKTLRSRLRIGVAYLAVHMREFPFFVDLGLSIGRVGDRRRRQLTLRGRRRLAVRVSRDMDLDLNSRHFGSDHPFGGGQSLFSRAVCQWPMPISNRGSSEDTGMILSRFCFHSQSTVISLRQVDGTPGARTSVIPWPSAHCMGKVLYWCPGKMIQRNVSIDLNLLEGWCALYTVTMALLLAHDGRRFIPPGADLPSARLRYMLERDDTCQNATRCFRGATPEGQRSRLLRSSG